MDKKKRQKDKMTKRQNGKQKHNGKRDKMGTKRVKIEKETKWEQMTVEPGKRRLRQ